MGFHSQRLNPLDLRWTNRKIGRKQDGGKRAEKTRAAQWFLNSAFNFAFIIKV